jgi:hypothetical protein
MAVSKEKPPRSGSGLKYPLGLLGIGSSTSRGHII